MNWIFIFQYFLIIIIFVIRCIYLLKQNIYEVYFHHFIYEHEFYYLKRIFSSTLLYKLICNNIEFLYVIILKKKKIINNYLNEYKRYFKR